MSVLPSKLVFVSLISSATLFGTLAIGSIAKAAPTVNCSIPNSVKCNISSSKGIKSVKIQTQGPSGPVYIVNESYQSCPLSVTVQWDSAYQASATEIVECQNVAGGGSGRTGKPSGIKTH
jgi:sorbitol-specific phosphotransferase system component IIBC